MKLHFINDIPRTTWKPKLGLGYLSAYLKKYLPEVKTTISFPEDNVIKDIGENKPDIVCLTAAVNTFKNISNLAKEIKHYWSELPLIIGGVHITLIPEDFPEWIDLGVVGEGEETLLEIVQYFQTYGKLPQDEINGTIFKKNGKISFTPPRKHIQPMDKIPFPDWDLLQVATRKPEWGELHIITSRGCPYRCSFCASANLWQKTRFFSAEYVVNEIEQLVTKFHQKKIIIYDDLFIADKPRVRQISEMLSLSKLINKVEFLCNAHVALFDETVAEALKKMNVKEVSFGMESGSERILSYLKRNCVNIEQIRNAVKLAKKYKIRVGGSFMIGSPNETEEDIQKTISFIRELDLDFLSICITTPYPKTQLWEDAKSAGLIKQEKWDDNLFVIDGLTPENINHKTLLCPIDKLRFIELQNELFKLSKIIEQKRWWYHFFTPFPDFGRILSFLKRNWKSPFTIARVIFMRVGYFIKLFIFRRK